MPLPLPYIYSHYIETKKTSVFILCVKAMQLIKKKKKRKSYLINHFDNLFALHDAERGFVSLVALFSRV